jgi:hypothetical protein
MLTNHQGAQAQVEKVSTNLSPIQKVKRKLKRKKDHAESETLLMDTGESQLWEETHATTLLTKSDLASTFFYSPPVFLLGEAAHPKYKDTDNFLSPN